MLDFILHRKKYILQKQEEAEQKRMEQERLWRLQNIFHPDYPNVLSKQDLYTEANIYLQNREKVLKDSIDIIMSTVNPDTFFYRLTLSEECISKISEIRGIIDPEDSFLELKRREYEHRSTLIKGFIDRYWNSTLEKIEKLKTTKAKQRRIDDFLSMKEAYKEYLPDDLCGYIDSKCK